MTSALRLTPPAEPVGFVPDPGAELPRSADAVIVGAGLVGAWTAYHLTRRGVRPLLIEANSPASGASGRNAGMLLQGLGGHFTRVTRLAQSAGARSILDYTCRSRELVIAAHDEIRGGVELDQAGSLDLFLTDDQAADADATIDAKRREGLDVRRIGPSDLADMEPALDTSRVVGASWTPSDLLVNPFRLNLGLLHAAVRAGATVATGVRVERLLEAGDGVAGVRTTHGDVSAPRVVVAANAWTPALVPTLTAGLTPIREHVCVTEPLARTLGAGFETNRCNEYWRQMASGQIVIGGFAVADEGMGIGTYSMETRPPVPPLLAVLLAELYPSLANVRIVRCWAGLLDFATLEIPMVGPLPTVDGGRIDGAFVACGLTGHGMPYAPIIGLLLSELIADGGAATLPLAPFDPARYAGAAYAPTWLEPFGVSS
ncbi:MAG: NAD(P)/FAD-dependent oxidoreductase [Candidatus Limnocylindria bacterium]